MIDGTQEGNYVPMLLTSVWPLVANAVHDFVSPILLKLQNWPTPEQEERAHMCVLFL